MTDHRIGLDLFSDVLDVLHRHGFTRGDDQHADRALFLIGDLARIYEGSQDHPTGPSTTPAPYPPAEPPGPEPEPGPPVPDGHLDTVTLTRAEVRTVLTSLDIAAEWNRDRAELCTYCADQSCCACELRLQDAQAYDQLTRQLHDEPAARTARRQPELHCPPGRAADKEAGQ
jgi:hypothetical protein